MNDVAIRCNCASASVNFVNEFFLKSFVRVLLFRMQIDHRISNQKNPFVPEGVGAVIDIAADDDDGSSLSESLDDTDTTDIDRLRVDDVFNWYRKWVA